MIRFLVHLVILAAVAGGAVYFAYGEVDPCRVLAVESSRRSAVPSAIAQPLARIGDAGESEGQCTLDLLHSWAERVEELL